MKFTKKEINKERKSNIIRTMYIMDIDISDGPLNDVLDDIKYALKGSTMFRDGKWEDGSGFKLSQCYIEGDYCGYDGGKNYQIIAKKTEIETDGEVIKRLTVNAKAKITRDNKKAATEKRERSLLKTLKEKYGEDE